MAGVNDLEVNEGEVNDGQIIFDPAPLKQVSYKVIAPEAPLKQVSKIMPRKVVGGR